MATPSICLQYFLLNVKSDCLLVVIQQITEIILMDFRGILIIITQTVNEYINGFI